MTLTTNKNGIRVLTPSDGMFLFNGTTYSQRVYLGINASPDDWTEASEMTEQKEDPELTEEEALDILLGGAV